MFCDFHFLLGMEILGQVCDLARYLPTSPAAQKTQIPILILAPLPQFHKAEQKGCFFLRG